MAFSTIPIHSWSFGIVQILYDRTAKYKWCWTEMWFNSDSQINKQTDRLIRNCKSTCKVQATERERESGRERERERGREGDRVIEKVLNSVMLVGNSQFHLAHFGCSCCIIFFIAIFCWNDRLYTSGRINSSAIDIRARHTLGNLFKFGWSKCDPGKNKKQWKNSNKTGTKKNHKAKFTHTHTHTHSLNYLPLFR